MTTEEQRALEYRRQMQAREDFKLAEEKRMVGSQSARDRINAAFEPLRRWAGWEPERKVKGDAE